MIPRRHPPPLLHHPRHILINLGRRPANLLHRRLLPRPRALNIRQRLLQAPQLDLNLLLSLLSIAQRHALKLLDRRQLLADVVGGRLEGLDLAFDLVEDGVVFEQAAVVGEVDGLGCVGEGLHFAAGVVVAFFEGGEGAGGAAAEAELGGEFAPVQFEGGAGLGGGLAG